MTDQLTSVDPQTLGISSALAYMHKLDAPVIHGDIRAVRSLDEFVVARYAYALCREMS